MQIKTPLWQKSKVLRRVFDALENKVRFVGGCVRDSLLEKPVHDIDLATVFEPCEVTKRLRNAGFQVVQTGAEFGTVTAVLRDGLFLQAEITTLRRDVKTNGRRAEVVFSDDWEQDAQRRDFTFNALYADFDGTLFDPCGGIQDLYEGRVRFIGDASRRIQEDYLRLLRYFRFFAYYSKTSPDAEALEACKIHQEKLSQLSMERVRNEFFKILKAPKALEALQLMDTIGLLSYFFPDTADLGAFGRLTRSEPDSPLLLRFSSLLPFCEPALNSFAVWWQLSKQDKKKMLFFIQKPVLKSPADFTANDCLRFWDFFGKLETPWVLSVLKAKEPEENWESLQQFSLPPFCFSGGDAIEAGFQKGPEMRRILDKVHEYWLENNGTPGRNELLDYLKNLK